MAIRTIVKEGDLTLRKKAKEVTVFDEKLAILLDDMNETMEKANGVGLAANQIGILKRAVVISHQGEKLELINPVITEESGEIIDSEGCLSISNSKNGKVKRPESVTVSAIDRNGKPFVIKKEGWIARIICHEVDHLEGILFIDKLCKE